MSELKTLDDDLVREAFKQGRGYGIESVWFLRKWTGCSLIEAAKALDQAGLVKVEIIDRRQTN
jgi:hypothetical protein